MQLAENKRWNSFLIAFFCDFSQRRRPFSDTLDLVSSRRGLGLVCLPLACPEERRATRHSLVLSVVEGPLQFSNRVSMGN